MTSEELKREIITRIKPIISSWNRDDIYAISFFVYDESDNPCEPTMTLGYNTEQQYQKSISRASSPLEAKWNYAFWLHNRELVFGIKDTAEIVKKWIIEKGLPYFTYHEMYEKNSCDHIDEKLFERITDEFVIVLINVVKELHEAGFITSHFKRDIPIIIHELEYYDKIAKQNIEANSLPVLRDFVDFMKEEGSLF